MRIALTRLLHIIILSRYNLRKMDRDNSGGECSTGAKKKKYYCTFNDLWLKQHTWLSKKDEFTAKCNICQHLFSVKFDGVGSVKQHEKSLKHQTYMKNVKTNQGITSFFSSKNSKEEDLITAAEVTSTFHGIKHHHSYNSQDCGHKLNAIMFSDSMTAKKVSCGRTKASSIAENVLGPASKECLLSNLKTSQYFSVAIDSSNKGNLKMYPLLIKYFSFENGIQTGLLDFYEDYQENSEAIKDQIIQILSKNDLEVSQISAYSADNAAVNYGINVSVYQKLKTLNSKIYKANCKCHILHNCIKNSLKALSVDVELIVLKVYSEFSAFAKRRNELMISCLDAEIEFREILRHVPTRWLSLLPAIDRILSLWPALIAYFKDQGQENCTTFLWNTFCVSDAETNAVLFTLYFMQNLMQVFQNAIKLLESDRVTSTEIHDIMIDLRTKLQNRQADQFYGKSAMDLLKQFDEQQKTNLKTVVNNFFSRCLTYLEKWYNFDDPEYQAMKILSLKEPITWSEITRLQELLNVDLDSDKLYDEFGLLREMQPHLVEEKRVDLRWVDFFTKSKDKNPCSELKKMVTFVLSIPVSNASCERIFSIMEQAWSKERNRMSISLIKAELQVLTNFDFTCKNFYDFVMKNRKILDAARKQNKYKFKN